MANPEIDNHVQSSDQKEIEKLKKRIEELEHRESSYSEVDVREEYSDIINIVDAPHENIRLLKNYIVKMFEHNIFSLEEFTRIWTEEMKLRNIIK